MARKQGWIIRYNFFPRKLLCVMTVHVVLLLVP
jgi:hypothetical protein